MPAPATDAMGKTNIMPDSIDVFRPVKTNLTTDTITSIPTSPSTPQRPVSRPSEFYIQQATTHQKPARAVSAPVWAIRVFPALAYWSCLSVLHKNIHDYLCNIS